MRSLRLALVPLFLLASTAAPAQAPEKKDVHIAVGGKAALYYLPLTIAEQLGYFKDEGLEVKISDFAGGSQSLRAVVGGSADVVSGAYEHTINMQAQKQSMVAFVQMGRAAADGRRHLGQPGRELQVAEGPEGAQGGRVGARFEHQHPVQLLHLARRAQAGRRVGHRRRRWGARRSPR